VISTAIVYFKRFFVKNSFISADPMLIIAASFYLATKTEESPVHIKTVVNEMKHLFADKFPYFAEDISEYEFYLLEALDFYTIVYHPYDSLTLYCGLLNLEKSVLQTACFVLNDTYRTDLSLMQPPHIIGLSALFVAAVIHRKSLDQDRIKNFFKELNVEFLVIAECAQILFNLYAVWGEYAETQISDILLAFEDLE
jgi:cyclin C